MLPSGGDRRCQVLVPGLVSHRALWGSTLWATRSGPNWLQAARKFSTRPQKKVARPKNAFDLIYMIERLLFNKPESTFQQGRFHFSTQHAELFIVADQTSPQEVAGEVDSTLGTSTWHFLSPATATLKFLLGLVAFFICRCKNRSIKTRGPDSLARTCARARRRRSKVLT